MNAIGQLATPAALRAEPRLDPPDYDDEPLTEEIAREEAERELMLMVDACAATIFNAIPVGAVVHQPLTEDREFFADETDFAGLLAVLLQSSDRRHIVSAAYRLRDLLIASKDGQEFIGERAKDLLDEEAKRHDAAREQTDRALRDL